VKVMNVDNCILKMMIGSACAILSNMVIIVELIGRSYCCLGMRG